MQWLRRRGCVLPHVGRRGSGQSRCKSRLFSWKNRATERMNVSVETVETYVTSILDQLSIPAETGVHQVCTDGSLRSSPYPGLPEFGAAKRVTALA